MQALIAIAERAPDTVSESIGASGPGSTPREELSEVAARLEEEDGAPEVADQAGEALDDLPPEP